MTTISAEVEIRRALNRSEVYKVLAKSFLYPTQEVYEYIHSQLYKETLLEYAASAQCTRELGNVLRELVDLLETRNGIPSREELEGEYNHLFVHLGSAKCPPYETEYGYDNVFQKTQAMADIAAFYRAYELEVADTNTDRVDFISTELEYMSYLALKEAYATEHGKEEHLEICQDSQKKFLQDHLGRWVKLFSQILQKPTSSQFYQQLGKLLGLFMASEVATLGVSPKEIVVSRAPAATSNEPFSCDRCARLNPEAGGKA